MRYTFDGMHYPTPGCVSWTNSKHMNIPLLPRIARITGTALLLFLMVVLIGAGTGDSSDTTGTSSWSTRSILLALVYPLAPIIGLAIAYWRPFLGGSIACVGFIAYALLRADHVQGVLLLMLVPGVLYCLTGFIAGRTVQKE